MKKLLIYLAGFLALIIVSAAPAAAFNPLGSVCQNAPSNPACKQNTAQNGKTENPAVKIIQVAVNLIATIAGVAAVIVVLVSGIQFITAGGISPGQRSGDPNKIKSARSALTGALIGLVVIALSWTIVTFVVDRFIS